MGPFSNKTKVQDTFYNDTFSFRQTESLALEEEVKYSYTKGQWRK